MAQRYSKLQSTAYHEAHNPGVLATRVSSIGIFHCNLRVQRSCCHRIFDEQAVLNVKKKPLVGVICYVEQFALTLMAAEKLVSLTLRYFVKGIF